MRHLFDRILRLPLAAHIALAAAAIVGFQMVKARLDASYAASGHPVDYATGQTTFDGQAIKGFYAHMSEAGTLDIYVRTQMIDFGFLGFMALMGLSVGLLAARAARAESWGRRAGIVGAALVIIGATFDAIENLISFVMLSNPTGFADWLAYPYSSAAVAKFACITGGMLFITVALLMAAIGRVAGWQRLG